MTTRKTDAELKPCPFGCHHRESKLVEALKKAKGALERTKKLTLGPSFELQDSIMCEVLEALREIRALLSTEAQK